MISLSFSQTNLAIRRVGVQTGTDGRTAQVDLRDQLRSLLQTLGILGNHYGVRAELLAKSHGHRVLQLGAAHLYHAAEFACLRPECRRNLQHRGVQRGDVHLEGDFDGRGIDIVGALAAIDVFQRM